MGRGEVPVARLDKKRSILIEWKLEMFILKTFLKFFSKA